MGCEDCTKLKEEIETLKAELVKRDEQIQHYISLLQHA